MHSSVPNSSTDNEPRAADKPEFTFNPRLQHFFRVLAVWFVFMVVSFVPFFFASTQAAPYNEIYGVKVIGADIYFHGRALDCVQGGSTGGLRDCSMMIDGKLLEISAPIVAYELAWDRSTKVCFATYGEEKIRCRLGAITGPQDGPYSIFSGVHLSGGELAESVLADRASWRNWRNLFLGYQPEEKLTGYLSYWSMAGLVLLYTLIPLLVTRSRNRFFVRLPSARMIVVSFVGLAVGLGIFGLFFGLWFVLSVLLGMFVVGVFVGALALTIFKINQVEVDVKVVASNLSMRLIHLTAMVPFIYAFALIVMIIMGYDD